MCPYSMKIANGDNIMAIMIREKINFRYLLILPVGSRISMKVTATIIMKIFLTHSLAISITQASRPAIFINPSLPPLLPPQASSPDADDDGQKDNKHHSSQEQDDGKCYHRIAHLVQTV